MTLRSSGGARVLAAALIAALSVPVSASDLPAATKPADSPKATAPKLDTAKPAPKPATPAAAAAAAAPNVHSPAVRVGAVKAAVAGSTAAKAAVAALRAAARTAGPFLAGDEARRAAEAQITPAQMKAYLTFLSSDQLQGRDTPSNGLDTAALFLATLVSHWGLRPAGDNGSYFQKIALQRIRPDVRRTVLSVGGERLIYGEDYVLTTGRRRGADGETPESAPLVYVSNGWVIPKRGIDAFRGVDVRGKILVVASRRLPAGIDIPGGPDFAGAQTAAQYGAAHGAAGIFYIVESETEFAQLRADALAGRGDFQPMERVNAAAPPPGGTLPTAYISADIVRRLFVGQQAGPEQVLTDSESGTLSPAFELTAERRARLTARYVTDIVTTQNVVAVWEGSEAALREQYVALGAHYDHLGMATIPDASGDVIYNGADDDGSGTTALLAMAEAFSHAPARPKRSVLFVWHCGEEKGLWGSAYFTAHPTVPLQDVSAQLNIDMIGRSRPADDEDPRDSRLTGPHGVYVIGSRMLSTELGNLSEQVNREYRNLTFDYRYDDPKDPERLYYRSDHYNYAKRGIPILFFFDGVHRDYHQRSDEIAKIDFGKMTVVARTVFLTAVAIADLPHKLVVDKKLPPAAKKAAAKPPAARPLASGAKPPAGKPIAAAKPSPGKAAAAAAVSLKPAPTKPVSAAKPAAGKAAEPVKKPVAPPTAAAAKKPSDTAAAAAAPRTAVKRAPAPSPAPARTPAPPRAAATPGRAAG